MCYVGFHRTLDVDPANTFDGPIAQLSYHYAFSVLSERTYLCERFIIENLRVIPRSKDYNIYLHS